MRPRAARRAAGGGKGCSPTPGPPKGGGGAAGSRGVQGVSPCAALPPGDGSRRSRRGCASEQRHERERMDARGDAVRVERTGKGPGEVSPGGLLAGTRGAGISLQAASTPLRVVRGLIADRLLARRVGIAGGGGSHRGREREGLPLASPMR